MRTFDGDDEWFYPALRPKGLCCLGETGGSSSSSGPAKPEGERAHVEQPKDFEERKLSIEEPYRIAPLSRPMRLEEAVFRRQARELSHMLSVEHRLFGGIT